MIESIGQKVKEIRQQNDITLKELSEKTGLSTSFLSQFERGLTTIAIDSLVGVAEALNTDLQTLLKDNLASGKPADRTVQHSYQRTNIQVPDAHQIHTNLSAFPEDKSMMVRQITLLPSPEEQELASYQHEGEEFLYVLEGVLTLIIDGTKHQLYPGDTAHFASRSEHIWGNETNRIVNILIVNYPNPM